MLCERKLRNVIFHLPYPSLITVGPQLSAQFLLVQTGYSRFFSSPESTYMWARHSCGRHSAQFSRVSVAEGGSSYLLVDSDESKGF
jgi:hypothetical protein